MELDFHIGEFTKVATFSSNNPTAKTAGWQDNYTTLLTARGRLRKKGGSRSLSFGEIGEENSYEFVTYYQDAIYNVLTVGKLKITIDSKTYIIASWRKVGEEKFFLVFDLNQKNG